MRAIYACSLKLVSSAVSAASCRALLLLKLLIFHTVSRWYGRSLCQSRGPVSCGLALGATESAEERAQSAATAGSTESTRKPTGTLMRDLPSCDVCELELLLELDDERLAGGRPSGAVVDAESFETFHVHLGGLTNSSIPKIFGSSSFTRSGSSISHRCRSSL